MRVTITGFLESSSAVMVVLVTVADEVTEYPHRTCYRHFCHLYHLPRAVLTWSSVFLSPSYTNKPHVYTFGIRDNAPIHPLNSSNVGGVRPSWTAL